MANEAGQGAVDRASSLANYTLISYSGATQAGNCTRFAVYGTFTEGHHVKFAFYTVPVNLAVLQTSVIDHVVTAGEAGTGKLELSSPGDFTAFAVTSGWLLGCWVEDSQDYAGSGGTGFWDSGGDKTAGGDAFSANSGPMDAFEADITAAGGSIAVISAMHAARRRQ